MAKFYLREVRVGPGRREDKPLGYIIAPSLHVAREMAYAAIMERREHWTAKGFKAVDDIVMRAWIKGNKYTCKLFVAPSCRRCQYKEGWFPEYMHVKAGVCFRCWGSGDEQAPAPQPPPENLIRSAEEIRFEREYFQQKIAEMKAIPKIAKLILQDAELVTTYERVTSRLSEYLEKYRLAGRQGYTWTYEDTVVLETLKQEHCYYHHEMCRRTLPKEQVHESKQDSPFLS